MHERTQPSANPLRGYITLAFGKRRRYLEMACALGQSLAIHEPKLRRAIVTDSTDPSLREIFTDIIPHNSAYGTGVLQKLHLDAYTPFDETLFIDSDCLVVRPLSNVWEKFSTVDFGAQGDRYLSRGDTDIFLNVEKTLNYLNVETLPKFNGGIYFFKSNPRGVAVFEKARQLAEHWREFCDRDFYGAPSDEALFSAAMTSMGLSLVNLRPYGMFTPIGSSGPILVDVLNSRSMFVKEGRVVTPDIVHFAGRWNDIYTYHRECQKLQLYKTASHPTSLSETAIIHASALLFSLTGKTRSNATRLFKRMNNVKQLAAR